jgi:hypothetical protein
VRAVASGELEGSSLSLSLSLSLWVGEGTVEGGGVAGDGA